MQTINKEKNYISAVVYIHNNENTAVNFLKTVDDCLNEHFEQYELIIVDDASTDESVSKLKAIVSEIKTMALTIVHMGYYHGLESSMRAGVDLAIGDFVYEFDNVAANFEKSLIFDVYEKSLKGFDFVSASNRKTSASSKTFYKVFNRFGDYKYQLKSETFRIISRRGINRAKSMNAAIPYRKATYARCGLKSETIYYTAEKNNVRDADEIGMRRELAFDSIILFTNFGYKVSMILTCIMMLFTIAVGIYTGYIFFMGQPVQGWTSTMLFLGVGFLGIFIVFTILIKYASLLLKLLFKKQEYVIEGIEKVTNSRR